MKDFFYENMIERRFINEMNFILNNYEKGKKLYPSTFSKMELAVSNFDDLSNIFVLEKALEVFDEFRNKLEKFLPLEKEKKIIQLTEMFHLLIQQEYDDNLIQERLDELKPRYNEILNFLIKEKEKLDGKKSFYWNGSSNELENIFNGLISTNLISKESKLEDFINLFSFKPINEIIKINWIGQKNLLAFLIDELNFRKRFKYSREVFSLAKDCFTNANNLSKLKHQYLGNKKKGVPKGYNIIEHILKTIDCYS